MDIHWLPQWQGASSLCIIIPLPRAMCVHEVRATCLTATTPCGVSKNFLSRMRQPWNKRFYVKERSSCARHFTEIPERLQTGEDWSLIGWGEAFTGAIIFARDRNRLRSDHTGLREVQQGYICAQKSSMPTQVRIARVSLSSSQRRLLPFLLLLRILRLLLFGSCWSCFSQMLAVSGLCWC